METKSGRSSKLSDRSTSSSRLSGSDVNLILERIDAINAVVSTRGVRETVIPRLEHIGTSPASKFLAGLESNPSLSNVMTAAPTHSTISLEVKQGNPEVSTAPVVLRRSERLVTEPKVDYRQVALKMRWPTSTAVSLNPGPVPTL